MDGDGDPLSMDANPISTVLATPSSEQDSLSPLADEDTEMTDDSKSLHSRRSQTQRGVRIDDHYYFEDDDPEQVKRKPRKGLNDYQAAWHISDSDQSDKDDEDEAEMEDVPDNESEVSYRDEEQSDMDDSASDMHVDLSPEEEARQ
jgi:hypothetical protein